MIHLSFKGAKLPARSLTPCGLERPLQTPGTRFHFAISKNLSLCASVSCQYKVQKSCFLQTAGIHRTHTPYMLVWSTHMHNYAALILLHCAKQRRNVWQLLVLRSLSNKGPLCVCVWVGENWTCLSHLHRTPVHPSDEPASHSQQEAGRAALYLTSTLTANTYRDLFCLVYAGWVPVMVSEGED